VGAGTGISIIPEALRWVFYSENVKFLPIPDSDCLRTYVVAWHKGMTNPAAKLFLDVVKDIFKQN
jgi:DNA-binding transcriptional LysR family regulator